MTIAIEITAITTAIVTYTAALLMSGNSPPLPSGSVACCVRVEGIALLLNTVPSDLLCSLEGCFFPLGVAPAVTWSGIAVVVLGRVVALV